MVSMMGILSGALPLMVDVRQTGGSPCIACDLSAGRAPLPGGLIHRTQHWLVEHCIGPLGIGTLIVKPERHVEHVAT
jgi:hypothetical protein